MAYGEMQTMNGAVYQTNRSMETFSLSSLIEFSIQRTYHELTILTELLPRKSDMERKIEIVKFVNRTKQLFIRLLALVKWAGSASKVEKCSNIVQFLDKQSMLFTETADNLAKMSREILVSARLPSFQLPSAVEVLTSGTYTRLPSCIRERIVPPDPITPEEKRTTLLRLNQIIQQRLVSTNLPIQMRNLKIEHGRVVFHIPHEFELTLTLMGDKLQIPWRVLSVVVLIEDKETGEGKDLVHSFQTNFLQHLVQEKLIESIRPLYDAFEILHSFCLSLQLEVLHAQTVRLSRERLGDFLKVDEYHLGSRLVISYWKDQLVDNVKGCKLVIEIKNQDQNDALVVSHLPELGDKSDLANQAIKSDVLSIEKLLICTTHERARKILMKFCEKFENTKYGKSFNYEICGLPPVLQISYLKPCMNSEKLTLSVDVLTGVIMVHIPQFDNCPFVDEIQQSIKKDLINFENLISDLRIWVTKERFKKSAEYLFTTVQEQLPFSSKEQHEIIKSRDQKLFFQFLKNVDYYLMVVFTDHSENNHNIRSEYYLLNIESTNVEYENRFKIDLNEMQRSFVSVRSLTKLNLNSIIKPNAKQLNDFKQKYFGKRKLDEMDCNSDRDDDDEFCPKKDSYFISELIFLLSFCEEKMAYRFLSVELHKRNFCHHIRFSSNPDRALFIDITQMPIQNGDQIHRLHRTLLNCSINLQGKFNKIWMVNYKFSNEEIPENLAKNNAIKNMISINSDTLNCSPQQLIKLIDDMINDWQQFCKLYDILIDFTKLTNYTSYLDLFEFSLFDYRKMVLNYGPNFNYTVTIVWKITENRYALNFGVIDSTVQANNSHVIVSFQLQNEFNQHKSISTLIKVLNSTVNSLSTIHQITCLPMFGLIHSKPILPIQTFCVIPQSSTHIRLMYRNVYCIDIVIQMDGFIEIRDGAFNLFDKTKILEDLTPIQGLKRFLNRFVDKNSSSTRHYLQNEEDNQLSPVAPNSMMDTSMESPYMYQNQQMLKNINSPINVNISLNESNFNTLANQLQRPPSNYHNNVHSSNPFASNPNTPNTPGVPPQNTYMPSPISHSETSPVSRFSVNSPAAVHASSPSTFHQQSPQIKQQPSPAPSTNWPNSPSIYRPSPRSIQPVQSPAASLNQLHGGPGSVGSVHNSSGGGNLQTMRNTTAVRSWSQAAFPTYLTQSGFEAMCRQNTHNDNLHYELNQASNNLSQLERFLGCVFMRKNLHQLISKADCLLTLLQTNESNVIQFRNDLFHFKLVTNMETMQNLQIKITSLDKNQLITPDEIETLERFFDSKVICEPFKPDAFSTFGRLINTPLKYLKDFIQLMRLELYPDRNCKWTLNLCLTISPATIMRNLPTGMSAFSPNLSTGTKSSIFFFIQLTQNPMLLNTGVEPQSLALPIVFDVEKNEMSTPTKDPTIANIPAIVMINRILRDAPNRSEYPVYTSIREIMSNDLITLS